MPDHLAAFFKMLADQAKKQNSKPQVDSNKVETKTPNVPKTPDPKDKTPSLDSKIPKVTTTTRAYPIKFHCIQRGKDQRFGLSVETYWESSDGDLRSLTDCMVAEEVIYPQPQNPPFEMPMKHDFSGPFAANQPYVFPADGKSGAEGMGQDIHVYTAQHVKVPCPKIRNASFVVKQRYVYRYRDTKGPWITIPGAVYTISYNFIQHQSTANPKQFGWCMETVKTGNGETHRSYEYGGSYTV